jgi:hypothetical protein
LPTLRCSFLNGTWHAAAEGRRDFNSSKVERKSADHRFLLEVEAANAELSIRLSQTPLFNTWDRRSSDQLSSARQDRMSNAHFFAVQTPPCTKPAEAKYQQPVEPDSRSPQREAAGSHATNDVYDLVDRRQF